MKKILSVDTLRPNHVHVELFMGQPQFNRGQKKFSMESAQKHGSQVLLDLIAKIVRKAKIDLKDLDEVKVKTGPGSFTGIKVGVAVANALAFALSIPINGKKIETDLKYD